jgi:hypothetical protein
MDEKKALFSSSLQVTAVTAVTSEGKVSKPIGGFLFHTILLAFWRAICSNEIVKVDNLYLLNFTKPPGYIPVLPKWRLSTSETDELLRRNEYLRIINRLKANAKYKYVFIRGPNGIGKSLFIYYLICSLVIEAKEQSQAIPSFVLYHADGARYYLYVDKNNVPNVVPSKGRDSIPDYFISDMMYDIYAASKKFNVI